MQETEISSTRRAEPPKAKRYKRVTRNFHNDEDLAGTTAASAASTAASDYYRYRCSRANDICTTVLLAESWLTNIEPFVMEKDAVDDGGDSDNINNNIMTDDDPMVVRDDDEEEDDEEEESTTTRRGGRGNNNDHLVQLRRQLVQTKRRLEQYTDRQFRSARRWCNPYEALDDTINLFLNRSALKLANIDALIHFRLSLSLLVPGTAAVVSAAAVESTPPQLQSSSSASPAPAPSPALAHPYFVDLCGAPGGFGEYLLWRGATCGYGMSLIGRNENGRGLSWHRELVQLQPHQQQNHHQQQQQQQQQNQPQRPQHHPRHQKDNGRRRHHRHRRDDPFAYEIYSGVDGTGDVYNWDNILALQQHIVARQQQHQQQQQQQSLNDGNDDNADHGTTATNVNNNNNVGAQLVLADGGVDAQRNAENQERVTIKLLVCQTAAALYLLRPHGTYLFKAFGFQSAIARAVMSYLCCHFDTVTVFKPITSRPASAERYVVAEGYRPHGCHRGITTTTSDDGMLKFDGPRWINRMLLAGSPADAAMSPQVVAFLDDMDVAMLTLNLKACGDILRRLHQMEILTDHEDMEEYDNDVSLPIFGFKTRWQLF